MRQISYFHIGDILIYNCIYLSLWQRGLAFPPFQVLVVEGRSRAGGRLFTNTSDFVPIPLFDLIEKENILVYSW